MIKPEVLQFKVGKTFWGQDVKIIYETVSGHEGWTIRKEAVNQRDDTVNIYGLTSDVIFAIAEAVRSVERS